MNGILNVYKPTGMTSFDVVYRVRKMCKEKKVGHAGTLDPEASGVLPVCVGKATKIIEYLMEGEKIYKAELKLGTVTDSYDREGNIIEQNEVQVTEEAIYSAVYSFVGESEQIPPMHSALKVNGKKLYELARAGIEIEREKRKIYISDIRILQINIPYVTFEVRCSKGTYIRSLCYDIGRKLGCGGMMWNLERVATGIFHKEQAISIEALSEENVTKHMIVIEDLFQSYEILSLNDKFYRLVRNGVVIKDKTLLNKIQEEIIYRVYTPTGEFMGLGKRNEDGFKMIKLLM